MIAPLISGFILAIWLAISVGPILFAIIKYSVISGFRAGLLFVLGVSFSDILYVVLGNFVSAFIYLLQAYTRQIGIGGGLLLIGMGLYNFFIRKIRLTSGEKNPKVYLGKREYLRIWISGFAMNTLNPGVLLFWFTICTGNSAMKLNYKIVLFSTCLVLNLGSDIMKVFLADKIRYKLTLKNVSVLNRISALILVIFGVIILWKVLFDPSSLVGAR
ncbi:MAG TPA: LysE family transporter [Chitinophagaceae bacterium]|nr:LysE family transporter [Chitinophagaceae bacterium]